MNPPVWLGSAAVVVIFVACGALAPEATGAAFAKIQSLILARFGWFYILGATGMLVFALWLAAGPFGQVRLGPPDSRPDFHFIPWVSMLLAAGMGIGIVFFGVSEPLQHYANPPFGEGRTEEAMRESLRFTFFHWGLHPWAIYTCIALPLAYFHFRHDFPLAPRSLLHPLLGKRMHGWAGHGVDILCTTGTLFGVATSLGLGAIQINAGLDELFDWPVGKEVQMAIIAVITAVATVSVVSGLKGGIRFLSTFNLGLAAAFLIFVLIAGPTVFQLELFTTGLGHYLQKLPATSLYVALGENSRWQADWTLFYWSWWISWSPFVGVFVARISKGRTIREFVLATLLVPSLIGFLWFSVMGGTGIHMEREGTAAVLDAAQDDVKGSAFFTVLSHLPFAGITVVLAVVLIFVFFVTSSDSGSFVDDMVTSGGDPNPPVPQRIFWAFSEGAVAAVLLYSGGLLALRSVSLTTGLPMTLFLLCACFGLVRALRRERRDTRGKRDS
jgi:choline/glycine/proline betaine transport protein